MSLFGLLGRSARPVGKVEMPLVPPRVSAVGFRDMNNREGENMTEFKVGDKVRLTGEYWNKDLKGTTQIITGQDEGGDTFFEAELGEWYITSDGYEAELVEPKRTLAEKRQDDFKVLEAASRPWRNAPDYYKFPHDVQTTDISMHLNSNGGQAVGYISRSTRIDGQNKEDDPRESLRKAIDLIQMEIYRLDEKFGGTE